MKDVTIIGGRIITIIETIIIIRLSRCGCRARANRFTIIMPTICSLKYSLMPKANSKIRHLWLTHPKLLARPRKRNGIKIRTTTIDVMIIEMEMVVAARIVTNRKTQSTTTRKRRPGLSVSKTHYRSIFLRKMTATSRTIGEVEVAVAVVAVVIVRIKIKITIGNNIIIEMTSKRRKISKGPLIRTSDSMATRDSTMRMMST